MTASGRRISFLRPGLIWKRAANSKRPQTPLLNMHWKVLRRDSLDHSVFHSSSTPMEYSAIPCCAQSVMILRRMRWPARYSR
jgi:hypothetical protein